MTSPTRRHSLSRWVGVAATGFFAVVLAGMLVAEATMQPSAQDRAVLLAVFGGSALVSLAVAIALGRATRRLRHLRSAVLAVALAAVGSATLAAVASAQTMFLSGHDLRLVLVALGLGAGLGAVSALTVTRPLAEDVHAIAAATSRIADGHRSVRTGVSRPDELGDLAAAVDRMADRLDEAADERTRVDEARRAFLAAVSHDLRTPLTSLRSALELLEDGMADDPARYLAAMQADTRLLMSLVDDLFLLATIESGGLRLRPERVDIAELADEAVEAAGPVASARGVRLALQAAPTTMAAADPREIQRVLRNLVDNAIRHTPEGGRVTVAVQRSEPTRVEVVVADDGPGFPADFIDRAFEGFTRADPARTRADGGAGLGLAIAKGLVDAHGGQITAAAGPGGRVTFWLPA